MGKAAEAIDDRLVRVRPLYEPGIGKPGHQGDAACLRRSILGVLERQIEKQSTGLGYRQIEASGNRCLREAQGLGIAGKRARCAPEHVARKLIEHDHGRKGRLRIP